MYYTFIVKVGGIRFLIVSLWKTHEQEKVNLQEVEYELLNLITEVFLFWLHYTVKIN
jgi:hypothetical protein